MLFGSIGTGYAIYGRNQKSVVPLLCGIALIVVPYFISTIPLLVVTGIALCAIPYFIRW